MRKGISELIAAAILMVLAIAITMIVAEGSRSFISTRQQVAEESSETLAECVAIKLRVEQVIINPSTNLAKATVRNEGGDFVMLSQVSAFDDDLGECVLASDQVAGDTADARQIAKDASREFSNAACEIFEADCSDFYKVSLETHCPGLEILYEGDVLCAS